MNWTPISRLALLAALVVAGVIGTAGYGVASAKACGLFSSCTVTVHVTGAGEPGSGTGDVTQVCKSPVTTPTGQEGNTCTFTFGWGWGVDISSVYDPTEGWKFKQWSGSGFAKPVHCDGEDSATNTLGTGWCHFWLWDNLEIRAEYVDTVAPDTRVIGPSGYQRSTSASFAFTSSDHTPSTFMCSLDEAPYSPCTSPARYTGLAQSSHTFRVRAFDPSGNGDPSPALAQWFVDTVAPQNPTLTPDHNPPYWSTNPTIGIAFAGAQDGMSGVDGYSYSWDQDQYGAPDTAKDAEETATGTTSSVLADGLWYFHLRTVDNAGNWSDPTTIGPFHIDRTPPTSLSVSLPAPAPSTSFTVSWSAADPVSGAVAYDVRYRGASARNGGTFGDYFGWKVHTFDLSAPFTAIPGVTYCFSIRAYDAAGNASSWGGERCSTVPLDDAALSGGANWTRTTGSGYYLGTVSRAGAYGSKLTATLSARRLIVLVTKCPTCGTIRVLWNGTIVATADLTAATTQKQARVPLPDLPQVQTGVLGITVTSSARPVEIDGVVASAL
jgi:hypothetical protein